MPHPSCSTPLDVCTSAASAGGIWMCSPEGIADEMRSRRGHPSPWETGRSTELEFRIFVWFWLSA